MTLRASVKRLLPRPLRQVARSFLWSFGDLRYSWRTGKRGFPPAYLRVKVCGSIPIESYLSGQEPTIQALLSALDRVGAKPSQFTDVLDFGCGIGRILVPFHKHLPQARFFGTDADAGLIRWSRKHIPEAEFNLNDFEPPLPYADASFDLIYGLSVFTHLDERLQFLWLAELRRVARPGAILILTVHRTSGSEGFKFIENDAWSDFFPDYYQTSMHTQAYVREKWGRYFTVLDYDGETLWQDLIVLRSD
jgi:SAM-dependent methyltransferase